MSSRYRVTCPPRYNVRDARRVRANCARCGTVGELSEHRPWSFDWTPDAPTLPAWLILVTGAKVEDLP